MKPVFSACQYLMGIGLVPNIPYEFIIRGIKHIMESNGQLNGTEA